MGKSKYAQGAMRGIGVFWGAFLFQTFEVLPPFPRADSKADLARLRSRQKDWVRFAKNGPPVLTASALAASEGGHLVRRRSRR